MKNGISILFFVVLLLSCGKSTKLEPSTEVVDGSVECSDTVKADSATVPSRDQVKETVKTIEKSSVPPVTSVQKETDNMRGFDPASEDDMDDNGMSRYMENTDEEGWD